MRFNKETLLAVIKDIVLIEIGLAFAQLGTALFYSAELGSGAMATFCDGLHNLIGTSYGTANIAANVVFLIVLFFLDKKYINVGTVLCVFTIGLWVNFFTGLLSPFGISEYHMVIRIIFSIVGAVFMGIGLGFYMAVGRGFGALEGIVKYLTAHTSLTVKTAKIIQDVVLSAAGILLGAAWGIGTVVGIFMVGPVLQKSSLYFGKLLKK